MSVNKRKRRDICVFEDKQKRVNGVKINKSFVQSVFVFLLLHKLKSRARALMAASYPFVIDTA